MNLPQGFEILNYQNSVDSLKKYREKGALRGVFLGFPFLDEHYTMATPGTTDWTGYGGSGKTEFVLELLLNTSLFYGWKHLLYVPDVGDKDEILGNLIHKLTGFTFDKRFSNYISEFDTDKNLQWILEHFYIIYEKDEGSNLTPFQFWDYAAYASKEFNIKTATIDSWKDLDTDVMQDGTNAPAEHKYLQKALKYRNKIADKYKIHLHTIIHPTNIPSDKDGKRPAPKPFNLSGGSQWMNSGRTMITVHRIDGTANEVDIIINKAKPKSVAKLGTVRMFFDIKLARFYWDNAGIKTYANHINQKPKSLLISEEQSSIGFEDVDNVPF